MSAYIKYNGRVFTGDDIRSGNLYLSESLPAGELEVDSLSVIVQDTSTIPHLLAADNLVVAADGLPLSPRTPLHGLDYYGKYGQRVDYFHQGERLAAMYLTDIVRVSRYEYQLHCVSAIGLLLTSDHYGGIYAGETAAEVISDVIGGIVPYTIDATLGATPLYGWLPKAVRRDNLLNILFAIGGLIRKDTSGEISIIPQTAGVPYALTTDEIYLGGSVTDGNPATGISVTEHTYLPLTSDKEIILFNGEAAAAPLTSPKGKTLNGFLILFDEPIHDLRISNSTILESGANYAVISQSPAATLAGQPYTHITRVIARDVVSGVTPNIISSEDCGLVNLLNSELVADRLQAYYSSTSVISADFLVGNQKPGDAVIFLDPFGDETTGYIGNMDIDLSMALRAQAQIVRGYVPAASGNFYTKMVVISQSGTWTVPSDCKGKIRIVLIGGGNGGSAGEKGQNGEAGVVPSSIGTPPNYGAPGKGSPGGQGGAPGKVYITTLDVSAGQTLSAVIGAGGAGAVFGGVPGLGGDTTLGGVSSSLGARPEIGYMPLLGNSMYAVPGETGIAGADAPKNGETSTLSYGGNSWSSGAQGKYTVYSDYSEIVGWGGLPGGPSVEANGGDGQDAYYDFPLSGGVAVSGGAGGAGGSPGKRPAAIIPGAGGHGGHGGGGGGGGGGANALGDYAGSIYWYAGPGGAGGAGGAGGDGAPGIILIYY